MGETLGWERPLWYAPQGRQAKDEYSYSQPNWFEHTAAECQVARENVVIFDQSSFGKHLIQGPDACKTLQRLCANNVDVELHRIVYTHMLNERGGIEVDITVNRLTENSFMLVSSAGFQPRDKSWIEKQLCTEDRVYITDVTSAYAVVSIQGPKSRQFLESFIDSDLSNEAFPFSTSQEVEIGYGRVVANRLTFIGEVGWELYIPTEFAVDIYDQIVQAGEAFDLKHAGYHALEHMRSERAYREFGLELTPDDTPYEAGLGFTVKLDKSGDFIGRKAVSKQKGQTLNKRLVCFQLNDAEPLLHKDELIRMNGNLVGYIRSGVYSFTLGRSIGMGYVVHEEGVDKSLVEGEKFEIEIANERYPAEASFRAFFDPTGKRIHLNC